MDLCFGEKTNESELEGEKCNSGNKIALIQICVVNHPKQQCKRVKEESAGELKQVETVRERIYDRMIAARVKGKLYKMVVRPAVMYDL